MGEGRREEDTNQKQEGSESQLIGANDPRCLRRSEGKLLRDVRNCGKQGAAWGCGA